MRAAVADVFYRRVAEPLRGGYNEARLYKESAQPWWLFSPGRLRRRRRRS